MRLSVMIAALVVSAPLYLSPAEAQPLPTPFQGQTWWGGRPNTQTGAWCANSTTSWDKVDEDCSFNSFSACQRALVNPSYGFCTQRYVYADPSPGPRRKKKKQPVQ